MKRHDNLYLDTNNRWRDKETGKLAPNPNIKRCAFDGCNNRVRSKKHVFCSEHIDWTKTSHGSSILTDDDVIFISNNYLQLNDKEIADKLYDLKNNATYTKQNLLLAIRHHRRKYLIFRYDKKFYYITIKKQYKELHPSCEICDWSEATIDIHHLWQVKDFENEADYHHINNLISVCPNHHRILEEMRSKNKDQYSEYINKL
jgi:hypothetical protein